MKKFFTILMLVVMSLSASAQHYSHDTRHHVEQTHSRKSHRHDRKSDRHFRKSDRRPRGRKKAVILRDIPCVQDWQELWNGCHVRIKLDKIYIYDPYDTKVVSGDEVILLPNGLYKVYNGAFWHVHAPNGERVSNIWGDEVDLMSNGVFRCYRAGSYVYYDPDGRKRE